MPQNVTTFQFKLVGDITLKQFVYLATGIILGYLCTKIGFIPGFLRWPMAIILVLFGVGLAFVPIEDRPLDRWIRAFIKSIYAPTQFLWKKNNPAPEILQQMAVAVPPPTPTKPANTAAKIPLPTPRLQPLPRFAPPGWPKTPTRPPPPPPPPVPRQPVFSSPSPQPAPKKPFPPTDKWTIGAPPVAIKAPPPNPQYRYPVAVTGTKVVFAEPRPQVPLRPGVDPNQVARIKSEYAQVTQKLEAQMLIMQKELAAGTLAKERFLELQQVLTQLVNEKERLGKEVMDLRQKLVSQQARPIETPRTYATSPGETKSTVKMVSPLTAVRAGIPRLTNQPNVITGIIKDSQGVLLPNLIITVKDREAVPVRALKTNKLGQFAASTPLNNGTYLIEVEDPKKTYQFNRVEVTLGNQVLPPLEISAISEKDLVRQRLSRELFNNNKI